MPPNSAIVALVVRPYLTLWTVTFAYFVADGLTSPEVTRYVVGPLHASTLVVGAAAVTFSATTVLARFRLAALITRFGPRSAIAAGCALLVVAFSMLHVQSLSALFASRILVGLADALTFTAATTFVYDLAPPDRARSALSYFTISIYLGLLVGPVLGETTREHLGYGSVWTAAALLGAVAAILATTLPRMSRAAPTTSPVGSVGVHTVWLPVLLLVAGTLGTAGYSTFVPIYATWIGQRDCTVDLAALAGVTIVVRLATGPIVDHHRPEPVTLVALAATAAGLGVIATDQTGRGLLCGTILLAAGQAVAFPVVLSLAVQRAPGSARTKVVSIMTACHDATYGLAGIGCATVARLAGLPSAFLVTGAASGLGMFALAVDHYRRQT